MKKELTGFLGVSPLFGAFLVKDYKPVVSLKDDTFTREVTDFEDKKVKITIETVGEESKNNS